MNNNNHKGSGDVKSKDVSKLQEHLALLRQEYAKLQLNLQDLQTTLALSSITHNATKNSLPSQLLKTVQSLYRSALCSDLKIIVKGAQIKVHKLVFVARSLEWGVETLDTVGTLDWSHIDIDIVNTLIKWIYTDQLDFDEDTSHSTLSLLENACCFKLHGLITRCEKNLIASVTSSNCIKYYSTACEFGAATLKEHCSALISTYWETFEPKDFADISGELLYELFKTKTNFPLHSAIRLRRDDFVFVYLTENVNQVQEVLNSLDQHGELPLGMALRDGQTSIASTLVEHGADVNFKDANGWTLLHKAIKLEDDLAAKFLIFHGASVTIATDDTGDTALHLIAAYSYTTTPAETLSTMVQVGHLIMDKGCDPNAQNNKGLTALHVAVMAGNEEMFSLLVQCQTLDLNITNEDGHTPLWYALICTTSPLRYNSNSFAAQLIENGATPNPVYSKDNRSLMHMLAEDSLEDAALFVCNYITDFDHTDCEHMTALHWACKKDLGRLVTSLLERGADPNLTTFQSGETPLHVAVCYSSLSALSAILNHKRTAGNMVNDFGVEEPDLNIKDKNGNTVLSVAVKNGVLPPYIDALIDAGASVDMHTNQGVSLLHHTIINRHSQVALFLIANHAKVVNKPLKIATNCESTLELAIKQGLAEVVESLLCLQKVDLSCADSTGNSYLWVALQTEQDNIASILVRHGIDTNFWSAGPGGCYQTLLHRAIDENEESIAMYLIRSGCDLNCPRQTNPEGEGGEEAFDNQTPLHLCCEWGLETIVKTLIEHGANVNVRDSQGKTPLHIAIQNQHTEIVTLLLCHPNLDLTLQDNKGLTPFATALYWHNHKAAKGIKDKLFTAAEQFDHNGRSFLHTAIIKGDVETFLFLLSIDVDVNSRVRDVNQSTPLHLAAQGGNEMLVRNLLLASAKPNDRDSNKRTALHVAAESGHENVVIALLNNNVDYDATDYEGDNALHVAVREGHIGVVKALLTESLLNAEAVNLKGRNPLHTLARFAKDNAASICELFLESMPNYPLDKPDLDGNTALILAYSIGHGNLCRTLVNAGACVAAMNREGITIFNYQVASNSKTLLKRLLDSLSKEPPWVDGDTCLECGAKFGLTMRKHHCRHCGRLLCSKCSTQEVPILKFNLNKPVRVCAVCFDVLHVGVN